MGHSMHARFGWPWCNDVDYNNVSRLQTQKLKAAILTR
jgi:hypothetical protein